jgi:phytoene desaturase
MTAISSSQSHSPSIGLSSGTTKGRRAIVIGSGFGGLAAAIRLQARGWQTTMLEMQNQPGGRASVIRDQGFTFDCGPTIITVPFVLEELAALAGKRFQDYVTLVPCDPFYRIYFHDKTWFDYSGDPHKLEEEIRKFSPDDVAGYRAFAEYSHRVFDRAFTDLAHQSFHQFRTMLQVAPELAVLRADQSVYQRVCHYLRDPKLRRVFSFNALLIGGSPLATSSVYTMIHHLEKTWGVHFAMGGTTALVHGLIKIFQEIGGTLRLGVHVDEIVVENGAARGVRAGGETFASDIVVSNADVANTYRKLIAPQHRRKWTNRRIEKLHYGMSLFVLYFGTSRTYPDIRHHSIILSERYEEYIRDIFDRRLLVDEMSLYLHAPTRTDPSLAPAGCDAFYVLCPVPNLAGGQDWDSIKESFADKMLEALDQEHLLPGVRQHIVNRFTMTPKDYERRQDVYLGAPFQMAPTLLQSAWFRPHNKSEDVEGLFFVGAGTHPGAGVPGVISSARVLDPWII